MTNKKIIHKFFEGEMNIPIKNKTSLMIKINCLVITDKQSGIDPKYISMLISKTNTSANLYLYQYYTPIHY
jgi:hypothetical protein